MVRKHANYHLLDHLMLLFMKYFMLTEVMWLRFHRFVVARFIY